MHPRGRAIYKQINTINNSVLNGGTGVVLQQYIPPGVCEKTFNMKSVLHRIYTEYTQNKQYLLTVH